MENLLRGFLEYFGIKIFHCEKLMDESKTNLLLVMPYQKPPKICPICKRKAEFKFLQDFKRLDKEFSLYECSECQVQFWIPFKNPGGEQYMTEVDYTSKLDILTKENCWLIVKDYWSMSQFLKHPPYKDPKGKTLLDLACGTGEFLVIMQNLGYEVYGVDFNERAVDFFKNNLGIKNVYKEDVIKFLEDKKEEYDVITAFEIIEHLDNPKKLLELVHRALKPGGYFAFSVPNRERYFGKISPEIEIWDFPYQHLTRWNLESLKNFIKNYPFEAIMAKKEIPISWFMSRLRILIESVFKKESQKDKELITGPVEKIRSDIGLRKYKFMKSAIKLITYLPALFLFYILGFEGGGLYILIKKK